MMNFVNETVAFCRSVVHFVEVRYRHLRLYRRPHDRLEGASHRRDFHCYVSNDETKWIWEKRSNLEGSKVKNRVSGISRDSFLLVFSISAVIVGLPSNAQGLRETGSGLQALGQTGSGFQALGQTGSGFQVLGQTGSGFQVLGQTGSGFQTLGQTD